MCFPNNYRPLYSPTIKLLGKATGAKELTATTGEHKRRRERTEAVKAAAKAAALPPPPLHSTTRTTRSKAPRKKRKGLFTQDPRETPTFATSGLRIMG
jgi:hypothetical protein